MAASNNNGKGYVFNIQRYSVQDGPGIRTTVFLKGCPARCWWCSNPESQSFDPEVVHRDSFCNKCGICIDVCEPKALALSDEGVKIDRNLCNNCGKCVPICPRGVFKVFGEEKTVDEVLKEVRKDTLFYRNSGGGVTCSGGEPLAQGNFLVPFFRACQETGLHTTLDTCGDGSTEVLAEVLPYTNLVLYDLKQMTPTVLKKYTAISLRLILENAQLIASRQVPMIFRVPLIPEVNDSEDNIRACCQLAVELKVSEIDLLPYHRFGISKYKMLDREYKLGDVASPPPEHVEELKRIIVEDFSLACTIGG